MSTAAQPGRADNNSSGSATHNLIRNGNAQPVKKDEEMLADLQSNEPSPSLPERFQGLLKRKRNRIISMYVAHKCQGVLSGGILKLRKANERHLNESKLSSEYVIELDKVLIFFNDRKRYIKLKFQKEAHILAPIYTTRDHEKRVRLYEAWKNAFTRHRRYRQGQVRDGLAANSSVANNSTLPSRSKTTRNNTADKRFAIVQPLNSNDKPLAKGISPRRKLPRQVTLDGATLPAFDSTVSKPAANGRRNDATPDERSEREKKTSRAVERVENLRAKNRVLLADIKKSHEIVKNTIFSAGSSDEDDEDEDEDSASDWANTAVTASPTAKQNTPRNAHKNLEETLNTTAIAGVEARQPAARPDEAVDTNGGNAKKLQLTSAVIADGRPPKGDASKGAPNAGSQLPPEIISTMLNEVNQMLIEMKQMYDHLKLKAGKPVANFEELPATKTTTTTPTGLVNAFGVKPQADSKNATTKAGIEPSAANSQPKVLVETESCKVIASPMSVSLRLGVSPMTPSKLSTTPTTAVTTTASSEVTAIWNGAPQHRLPRSRRSLLPAVQVDLQPIPFMAIAMGRLPIWAYEPLGALQILCEELRFASDLLSRAVSCDTSATLRMAHVAAFVLSGYTSLVTHKQKPFNPLRGETFDYVSDDGWQFHAEQVSHHPPISAAFAHHRDWEWHNCCKGDTRLTINGMGELIYKFPLVIYLNKFNEVYTYNKVKTLIINPLKCANRRVIRQEGLVTIQCSNGLECRMAFNNCAENSVSGSVYENHKVALRLVGNWDKGLSCIYDNGEQCRLFEAPAIVRELADRYYGFNPFSVTLNELHAEEVPHLPSTDSRFRPDQRYLEQGEVQKATDAKYTLEKNQRRREVLVPNFQPMWFHQTSASLNTSVANSGAVRNEGMWWTNAKYWESRALRFQDSYSSRMVRDLFKL